MAIYSRSSMQNINSRGVPNQEKQITKFKNQHDIDKIYLYTKDPYVNIQLWSKMLIFN